MATGTFIDLYIVSSVAFNSQEVFQLVWCSPKKSELFYEVQIWICCPIWFQASSPDIAEVESFTKQFEDVFKVRGQWVGDYPWKKGILVSHEMMLAILDEEI